MGQQSVYRGVWYNHFPYNEPKETTMFEIAMLPAASVLAVQHDLSLDGMMLELGQTSDGPSAPKPRLMWVDMQQGLGQTDDGPRPPPPGK
jgi:hypothetical protein